MPCIERQSSIEESNCSNMSELLKRTIFRASNENRLQIGLLNCVEHLYSCDLDKVLAIALTDNKNDPMTQTIIETYCYEYKIPFIKADAKLLKMSMLMLPSQRYSRNDPCCFLILKPISLKNYPDELSLLNLVRESESRNETLVIGIVNSPLVSPTTSTVDALEPGPLNAEYR